MFPKRGAGGFTLIELVIALSLMVLGLVSLAGVFVPLSRQGDQAEADTAVLHRARSLLEEIHATAPDLVASTYDGDAHTVPGVQGNGPGGTALTVDVDSTNPKLLIVTVTGDWTAGGTAQSLVLGTRIYNPNG
jgi:Tfp pilus assembly protein PilV